MLILMELVCMMTIWWLYLFHRPYHSFHVHWEGPLWNCTLCEPQEEHYNDKADDQRFHKPSSLPMPIVPTPCGFKYCEGSILLPQPMFRCDLVFYSHSLCLPTMAIRICDYPTWCVAGDLSAATTPHALPPTGVAYRAGFNVCIGE